MLNRELRISGFLTCALLSNSHNQTRWVQQPVYGLMQLFSHLDPGLPFVACVRRSLTVYRLILVPSFRLLDLRVASSNLSVGRLLANLLPVQEKRHALGTAAASKY